MNFGDAVDACAEALLCDRCLALYGRSPETAIAEFCPRCQRKMGADYAALLERLLGADRDDPS